MIGCALIVAAALPGAAAASLPVDADWFGGRFKMAEITAVTAPVAFDPAASPDAVTLLPGKPVVLPLAGAAETLYVLAAGQGPVGVGGIAADGVLRYVDGRTQSLKWMVGEQIWPVWAGATGRGAHAVSLGTNIAGDRLTASLLAVDLAFPDAPLGELSITARPGALEMVILGVALAPDPPRVGALEAVRQAGWYPASVKGPLWAPAENARALGPVSVVDGHLAVGGKRARFWGVNLVGRGNLPTDPNAFAATLREWGFNLARLHHLDSEGVLLNPSRVDAGQPLLLPASLDHLDRVVAALSGEGIRVILEGMTQRRFLPGEVPGPADVPANNKYVNQVWPEWLAAEKEWFAALWGRVNPYTGARYADDPTVALVELSNENSLVTGWSNGNLERLPRFHRDELDRRWNAWLREKYGTDARIGGAWLGSIRPGVQPGETLVVDSIGREPASRQRTDLWPIQRAIDLATFYQEIEAAHQAELARFVRELGFRVPIVCNTSFGVPAGDWLYRECDAVDVHLYWDPIAESNAYTDASLVETPTRFRTFEQLSACQEGKPCIIGELNHSWPNAHGHEAPLAWAAIAARQDVDAVVWFAWSHDTPRLDGLAPRGALDLEARTPALIQMPAASRLFRDALVPAAQGRFTRWWSLSGIHRDFAEPPGLPLPPLGSWRSILDMVLRTSYRAPSLGRPPAPSDGVRWEPGQLVVDTPQVQGMVGQGDMAAQDLAVHLEQFATVVLERLHLERPTVQRLTVVGRCEPEGTVRGAGGMGSLSLGTGPVLCEPLTGEVRFRHPRGRPVVVPLLPEGGSGAPLSVKPLRDHWWALDLAGVRSPWFAIGTVGEESGVE